MKTNNSFYIHKLKEDLSNKQKTNPLYSQRSYAKFLGIHSATLNLILNGKRSLPAKNIKSIADKLTLNPKEKTLFVESLYKSKFKLDDIQLDKDDDRFMVDESHFKVLSEWEHCATLTLFDLSDFIFSVQEISSRLNITPNRSEVVIFNLLASGLLVKSEDGNITRAHSSIRTTEDIKSHALRLGHIEVLDIGKNKLDEIEVELRDFSAMTIALSLNKVPEAKTIIREFRQKMSSLLKEGYKTDVYQMAIQFYPLTKTKKQMENL
jgi:uncharacterized protein (TIGR02147 family)